MEEQLPEADQSPELPGTGFFLSVDLLDELMTSLASVYGRLLLYQKNRPVPDVGLIEKYSQRREEILLLKESFPLDAVNKRAKASPIYAEELDRARVLLERQ